MIPTVNLCRTDDEYEDVFRLRYAVYVDEMGKPYPQADHQRKMLFDDLDSSAVVLSVRGPDDRVVGSVRCNWADDVLRNSTQDVLSLGALSPVGRTQATVCSRLVMASGYRQRGALLSEMLRSIYRWGLENSVTVSFCYTTEQLFRFFEHLGFHPSGPGFFDPPSNRSQHPMRLDVRDVAHLAEVGSPFLKDLLEFAPTSAPPIAFGMYEQQL